MQEGNQPMIINHDEAMEILRSVKDPVTNQLMNMANFEVLKRFLEHRDLPACDFDLVFFLKVVKDFCSQHEAIRKILAGEDLKAWTDT